MRALSPRARGRRSVAGFLLALLGLTAFVVPAYQAEPAFATVTTIGATGDTYVTSNAPDTANGSANPIFVSSTSNRGLVRYNTATVPAGSTVNSVTLRLYSTVAIASGGIEVHPSSDTWVESTVTWNTAPSLDPTVLATSGVPGAGAWLDIVLPTSSITVGGNTSFALRYTVSGQVAKPSSREDATNPPQLVVDYTPPSSAVSGKMQPIGDTYVASGTPTTPNGSANPLNVSSSSNLGFIEFDTSAIPTGSVVTGVKLRLYPTVTLTSGGVKVQPVADGWTEAAATYNNQPVWDPTVLATSSTPVSGTWLEVTLPTTAVSLGVTSNFGLKYSASGQVAKFASREDGSKKPELLVDYTPPAVDATLNPSADTYVTSNAPTTPNTTANPIFVSSSSNRGLAKFDTVGVPPNATVNSVTLRLYSTVAIASGGVEVHPSVSTWAESVTWNTAPSLDPTVLATSGVPGAGAWLDIVLPNSSVTKGGTTAFALRYTVGGQVAKPSSREDATNKPELVVNYTPGNPGPIVTTDVASGVGENSATLNGSVNPQGRDTTFWFEYGATTNYGSSTPATSAGSGSTTETKSVAYANRFFPDSTMHYRIVAVSSVGVSVGADQTFTTSAATSKTIAAAGDIACSRSSSSFNNGDGTSSACQQKATSDLVANDPTIQAVLTLGDNQYECGSYGMYSDVYDSTWGRFKAMTFPATGNHEYATGTQVTDSYCRGSTTAAVATTDTTVSVDQGQGQIFPQSGTYNIKVVKTTCGGGQACSDPAFYERMTVTAGAGTNNWTVTRAVNPPVGAVWPLSFSSGDYITYDNGTDARGYYQYFGSAASPDQASCTTACAGYYSFNIGNWHVVAVNSSCSSKNGTTTNGCVVGTPQYNWVQADLAAVPQSMGVIGYWHHPRYSRGQHGDNVGMDDMWKLFRTNNADLVLSGHDHDYERFDQLGVSATATPNVVAVDAAGVRQFVVGSGGKNKYAGFPNQTYHAEPGVSLANNAADFGVLKMVLGTTSYSWEFLPISGVYTDTGSTAIHN